MSEKVNAASSNIFVFPTTKREANKGLENRTARLFTEKNLVDIINKLLDVNAFVISKSFSMNDNSILEYNMLGYLFRTKGIQSIIENVFGNITPESNTPVSLWANIFISKVGDYEELYGIDDEVKGVYTGVVFFDSPISNASQSLELLRYTEDLNGLKSWIIPKSSKVKLSVESLPDPIDCGEIV